MADTAALLTALGRELVTAQHPHYDDIRRPAQPTQHHRRPRWIVRCTSASDVVAGIRFARENGERIAVRGGGHCFAGRSSTDGLLLDLSGLDSVTWSASTPRLASNSSISR